MNRIKLGLIALLSVFALISCDKEEDAIEVPTDGSYVGSTTTVLSASNTPASSSDNVTFIVDLDEDDSTLSVTMQALSFITGMPPQTMVLDDISYSVDGSTISFSTDSLIPEIDDVPYPSREITNLVAQIKNGKLTMDFTCMSAYTISYTGILAE